MHSSRLARAAQLHASGNLISARREAESALADNPNDVLAQRFAGVLYCQTGEPRRGAEFLRKALAQDPADEPTRINLLQALLDSGEAAEADTVAKAAPRSTNPQLLRARAAAARQLGNVTESISLLSEAVKYAPRDFAAWNNLGNALHEADQAEGAVKALRYALSLNPGSPVVHLNLGRALASAGRHVESVQAFQEALRRDPQDGMAAFEVGKGLLRLGRAEEALPILGTAARLRPTEPNIFVVMGLTYPRLNELGKAEEAYRMAIHVDPHFGSAYLNLSILLERGNRVDELKDLQQQALANGLSGGEAGYVQALILRRTGELEEALKLAEVSAPPSLDPSWRAQFIGEVADKLGDADTAFAAFTEMNNVTGSKPDAVQFDRSAYRRHIEMLTQTTTREWFESWRPAEPASEPRSPAILAGFIRSGTTLLDTILMGHPGTQVIEEEPMLATVEEKLGDRRRLGELGTDEINALRDLYFAEFSNPLEPGKLVVDKNPLATLRAPIIYRLFPDARFIFALRHPCDVVLSCFMQNFQVTSAMASFLDLESAALVYDRAMTFWHKCRDIFPLKVHTVRYDDLVRDFEGQLRPLLEFLGLEWHDRLLDHQSTAKERGYIRTPSYAQVTEQVYVRASGRWERYRKHMEPVLPILAPWVERFGYEPIR